MRTSTTTPRLLAAAKEFNIGKESLVEFLTSKGFEISSNPSTKISTEMYVALKQEFGDEEYSYYDVSETCGESTQPRSLKLSDGLLLRLLELNLDIERSRMDEAWADLVQSFFSHQINGYKTHFNTAYFNYKQFISYRYKKLRNRKLSIGAITKSIRKAASVIFGCTFIKRNRNISLFFRKIVRFLFKNMDDNSGEPNVIPALATNNIFFTKSYYQCYQIKNSFLKR